MAGGAGGFKLVGIAMGAFVHSQALGMAMGAYGASLSVYSHFIARGRELVFPKTPPWKFRLGPVLPLLLRGSPKPADTKFATALRTRGLLESRPPTAGKWMQRKPYQQSDKRIADAVETE